MVLQMEEPLMMPTVRRYFSCLFYSSCLFSSCLFPCCRRHSYHFSCCHHFSFCHLYFRVRELHDSSYDFHYWALVSGRDLSHDYEREATAIEQ